MTFFQVGDKIRLKQDLKQQGWNQARKAGAVGTVIAKQTFALMFIGGTMVEYDVRFEDGTEATLGNAHLLAEKVGA